MDIIRLLVVVAVVGLVVWLIEAYTPLDPAFKNVLRVIAIIGCVLMALRQFGVF